MPSLLQRAVGRQVGFVSGKSAVGPPDPVAGMLAAEQLGRTGEKEDLHLGSEELDSDDHQNETRVGVASRLKQEKLIP